MFNAAYNLWDAKGGNEYAEHALPLFLLYDIIKQCAARPLQDAKGSDEYVERTLAIVSLYTMVI